MKKIRPFLFAMFLAITCANISLHAQCVVPLGSSTNMFSTAFNRPTNIVVNNDLNTVLFIHRQDISVFGGNSGTYQYDISTDNGVTWQLNQGSLNPGSTSGVNAGRYPQVGLYNPAGNLDIASASLVYHGATVAGSDWNGYVSGSLLLDGAATATEHYNQAGASNPFIAGGLCQSVPGTFWAIDAISDDDFNGNGIRILKGVYDAGDISWSVQTELMPDFNLDNGIPQLKDWNMAFDPSGMNGWAVLLTHLNGLSDYNYYPVFYNTTDGGATWSGPVQLDPATFSSITAVEPNPVCAREVDLVVDASGNPHALIGVFKKNQGDYSYAINSVPFGHMFDFTYNGNWSAVKIAQTSYLSNDFFSSNPTYNRPQVSRSDDGNKIVFTWVESELPFIPNSNAVLDETNYAPNLKAVTYDLPTGTLSCAKNYALVCPSDLNGKMYQTSVSPNMIEDGDVYTVPVVLTILNESGDPNAPAQYYYLNDLSFTAVDFTAASTTSSMTITADGNLNICAGQSVALTASESSSYLWSTGETTQTITAYGGAYWVVNPDESTCIAGSNSIVVDAVQPFNVYPYSSTVFCPGGVDTVDIAPFTWDALPLDASIVWNTGQTTDVITANSPGIYTASINGCWAVDTVLVEDLDAPSNDDICDASELAAGTTMSFQLACATVEAGEIVPPLDPLFDPASQDGWFDDSYAGAPVVNNTVWYRFTAPSSGNVSISTDGLDSQLALYSSSDNSCSGELTLIAANDDGGTNGASLINKVYCFEAGKTYFIQVDLPLYWYLVHSGTILMNAAWNIPAITNNSNVLQSDATNGNQWYDQNGPIAGATGQTYMPTVTGNYYTIVTVDGCSTAPSNTINVTIVGVDDLAGNLNLLAYPNPVSDQLFVELTGNNDVLPFKILNALGQTVTEGKVAEKAVVDTQQFASGIYLLMIHQGEKMVETKFVKK